MHSPDVRRIPCGDRTMGCGSCKARAAFWVTTATRIWFTSCARHVEGHERRVAELLAREAEANCESPWHYQPGEPEPTDACPDCGARVITRG